MPVAVAGALVVAVAVVGAFALRSPSPAAAPRSSAPLTGAPPLVLDLPQRPKGGEAALAAVSADIGAGRRAQAETSLRRARALLGAGDMRVQVAGARAALSPGRGGHRDRRAACARGRRRPRARARAPPRSRAALVRAARRGYGRAGGDALARSGRALRAHRRQRAAPVLSQELPALGALAVRARLAAEAAREGRGRAALARGAARLRLRAPVRLAHTRAPRGGEGARARRQQHRRTGRGDRAGLRQGHACAGGRARWAS